MLASILEGQEIGIDWYSFFQAAVKGELDFSKIPYFSILCVTIVVVSGLIGLQKGFLRSVQGILGIIVGVLCAPLLLKQIQGVPTLWLPITQIMQQAHTALISRLTISAEIITLLQFQKVVVLVILVVLFYSVNLVVKHMIIQLRGSMQETRARSVDKFCGLILGVIRGGALVLVLHLIYK